MSNEKKKFTASQLAIKDALDSKLGRYFATSAEDATEEQMYKATLLTVKDILTQRNREFYRTVKRQGKKRVYYMCMEFLIGPSLKNNLCNLGMAEDYRRVLSSYGFDLDEIYAEEADPGLGNGGLGRLASCYLDSLTACDYPATGFSICYEYGLFRQKIVDCEQIELPDVWMPSGEGWLVPRNDKACAVRFGGHVKEEWKSDGTLNIIYEDYDEVEAVPYDMMISGADTETVNHLRLWRARDTRMFNMNLFSQGQYVKAIEESSNAEIISKVLYPADNHEEGKLLRLTQQYFLVSASVQTIVNNHLSVYGTLENFTDKVAIHVNDTHPAMCIPELMRILIDNHQYEWDKAWDTVTKVVTYTNHTVMPEALECWNENLFKFKLPRIYTIICEINRRFCEQMHRRFPGEGERIGKMAIIGPGTIRMANLCVIGSHTVNGVSKLHSEILKKTIFFDFARAYPDRFTNVTNGIAYRRWLCYSNPGLASLLCDTIGDSYRHAPERLADFAKYKDDIAVLERLETIKTANKAAFARYVFDKQGIVLDEKSVFDVQAKRMHEYKRQLLNVLRIVTLYNDLLENPDLPIPPQTFIFSAKAAQSYYMAKQIIKLICCLSAEIEKNPRIAEKIKVVFVENYCVSLAEKMIPAANISEQISLAGKEASGTGNMKFMMNGAVTLGTMDGANVEIFEAVGSDNIYIFGHSSDEVDDIWSKGYNAAHFYHTNPRLKAAIDRISNGVGGVSFENVANSLIANQGISDPYMCLADYDSYMSVHDIVTADYQDRTLWNRKSLINIAGSGVFAADRSVREYCNNIWHATPLDKEKPQLAEKAKRK